MLIAVQDDEEAQTFKELDSRFRRTFLNTLEKSGYEEDRALFTKEAKEDISKANAELTAWSHIIHGKGVNDLREGAEGARQTSIMSDLPIKSRFAALNLSTDALSFIYSGDGENTFSGTEEKNIASVEHVIKMRRLWALPIPTMEELGASENSQGSRT
ncbi:hypothetical protein I308_105293 [Cryptococcus tetragattii IND107]|uniref:Uncharacterized protein n=1 Tax=Cryptococcus tetragattii IND107 TaxID=1296105 RepID=A0ABR3BML2_9TREE